jgi:XTP/dITP diphosphohydrolase
MRQVSIEAEPYFTARVLAASGNRSKILELQGIASDFGIEVLDPVQYSSAKNLPGPPDVEEFEPTFRGNAVLKALAYCRWAGMPVLADDSGLEIDALGGAPGVHSARYAGEGASDKVRWRKVLEEMAAITAKDPGVNRSARFRCSLVLAYPNAAILEAESKLEGLILEKPRGSRGFGYDPIVYIPSFGMTLAEMDFERTCREGFRAVAARALFRQVEALK